MATTPPLPPTTEIATEDGAPRRVVFCRGRHRWTMECDGAGRLELLRWVAWCAEHAAYPIDRFDAAVITRHFVSPAGTPALNPEAREAD